MRLNRRVILLISILAIALCAGLVVFFLSGRSTSPVRDSAKAPAPAPAGAPALIWQLGNIGPTKVFIEGKASCIRVKWTGSRGPCSWDFIINPTEEIFFTQLPPVGSWPVSAADPKKRFSDLQVGDAVVKTVHADSECDQTFWVDGVVSASEECVAVRFPQGTYSVPYAATDLIIPLPPDAEQRGKLKFDEVESVIKNHREDIEGCLLANHIQYNTNWYVDLEWIIDPEGAVIRPRIDNPTSKTNAATPEFCECLLQRISQWRFQESAEGMRIRFRFDRFNPRWE